MLITGGAGNAGPRQELAELAGTRFLQHTLRQRQVMSEEYAKKLEPVFMHNATKFPTQHFNLNRCAPCSDLFDATRTTP